MSKINQVPTRVYAVQLTRKEKITRKEYMAEECCGQLRVLTEVVLCRGKEGPLLSYQELDALRLALDDILVDTDYGSAVDNCREGGLERFKSAGVTHPDLVNKDVLIDAIKRNSAKEEW